MAFRFVVTVCDCVKLVDGIYVSLQSLIVATGLENCRSVTNEFVDISRQSYSNGLDVYRRTYICLRSF